MEGSEVVQFRRYLPAQLVPGELQVRHSSAVGFDSGPFVQWPVRKPIVIDTPVFTTRGIEQGNQDFSIGCSRRLRQGRRAPGRGRWSGRRRRCRGSQRARCRGDGSGLARRWFVRRPLRTAGQEQGRKNQRKGADNEEISGGGADRGRYFRAMLMISFQTVARSVIFKPDSPALVRSQGPEDSRPDSGRLQGFTPDFNHCMPLSGEQKPSLRAYGQRTAGQTAVYPAAVARHGCRLFPVVMLHFPVRLG